MCRAWQGRGPCSASPRLTSVQCTDSWPRLPCSKWCWDEGVAFSWLWDVLPGPIWASLGSPGRQLESYWQRGAVNIAPELDITLRNALVLTSDKGDQVCVHAAIPSSRRCFSGQPISQGRWKGDVLGGMRHGRSTAAVCLSFPYASALPPGWSRWHCQDFHPS